MPSTLKINSRDLSAYLNVQHDAGFDPVLGQQLEPVFSGSPALGEGQLWTADSVGNREWTVPLILTAASNDALAQLVSDIRTDLRRGVTVEFKTEAATNPSFFDLERGRLEEHYEHFLVNSNTLRVTLKLWTRPYARVPSVRAVASMSGTGPQAFPATGILGDTNALAQLRVRVGSYVASSGRLVAYGVHRSASYNAIHYGPSILEPQANTTVVGASGAMGSQYVAVPVGPTVASGVALRDYIDPVAAHVGHHRVFGVVRSGLFPDTALSMVARDRFGAVLGPTVVATQNDSDKWQLVDFGQLTVPERRPNQENIPTQYIEIAAGGASGASILASPALMVNALMLVPQDVSAGLIRTPGYSSEELLLMVDTFRRFTKEYSFLETRPIVRGGAWSRISGFLGNGSAVDGRITAIRPASGAKKLRSVPTDGATGLYALGTDQTLTDLRVTARHFLSPASVASRTANIIPSVASPIGPWLRVFAKSQIAASGASEVGVYARLVVGPSQYHSVALCSDDGTGSTIHASAALGASSATAYYQGRPMDLVVQTFGGRGDVWAFPQGTTVPASPLITASHSSLAMAGWPALEVRNGAASQAGLYVDELLIHTLSASPPDSSVRSSFSVESFPEDRVFRGNATVYQQEMIGRFRGNTPQLPPVGSPGASGPARVVVLAGDVDNFRGNDLLEVELAAVERFTFLR